MSVISVILVDWIDYPLYRKKKIGEHNIVSCGVGAILENMSRYQSGFDYEVTIIITGVHSLIYDYILNKFRIARHYLRPKKYSIDRVNFHSKQKLLYSDLMDKYKFVKRLHYKDNVGQDIGAYNYGYQLLKQEKFDGCVVFMNSAVEGPNEDGWLLKYANQFSQRNDVGFCGVTINPKTKNLVVNDFCPHVQSFFIYTNMSVLQHVFPENLSGYNIYNDRLALILNGEIGLSKAVLEAGYCITSIAFPDHFYREGDEWTLPYEEIRFKKEFKHVANRI